MSIDFLLERFAEDPGREALVWRDRVFDYRWLLDRMKHWGSELDRRKVEGQAVVLLEGDYSPNSLALMLSLVRRRCVVVPLTEQSRIRRDECAEVVRAECLLRVSSHDDVEFQRLGQKASHPLYERLRKEGHPALVLFSSGSTGPMKAAVHDFERLLSKYRTRRRDLRTLTFLLYDHIGGIDTLLYSLSNASCMVAVADRLPDTVCAAVQSYAVEVLPVSPSFLALLILSQAYERYDLSSLKVITYGAEVMPESTLRRCHQLFPGVELLQKFGATEVGTLRSKSKAPDSTWVKIGGEGYQVRVVDGILQIKARSAILGYLNAPDPFTEDGWFVTGDLVEVDGEYLRILGRQTDIVNVGGEKVIPAEVENVIQELDVVQEVAVYGEPNPILGNIVCAQASLVGPSDSLSQQAAIRQIKAHCRLRLERYKVPVKITIVSERLHTDRFKKARRKIALGEG
jgi:acyl-CoA synthetase (AMP-forming)/AMP-acid ligase II